MKNLKRYPELVNNEVQSVETNRAKPNQARLKRDAEELHNLLRTYTYRLIGLGNAFRRIARDFSALDGSNWKNNRHVASEVAELAKQLYKCDPMDVYRILNIENKLLTLIERAEAE